MKLKLSHSEFFALYKLLQIMTAQAKAATIETRLLKSVLLGIYEKFYKRAFDNTKKKYTVPLKEHEACAWYMFFSLFLPPADMVFEINLVHKLNTLIHQKLSV